LRRRRVSFLLRRLFGSRSASIGALIFKGKSLAVTV
jgi:hypothetical protein